MFAGLDFGTSNCSIAVMENGHPVLLPLEDGKTRLPSSLFIEHGMSAPAVITEEALGEQIAALKSEQDETVSLTQEQLVNIARKQLRKAHRLHNASDQRAQSIVQALAANGDVIFGEEAELMHISDPESGFYIKSPKSFLGADINVTQRAVFTTIVEKMLAFIKQEAESLKHNELSQIMIGRPVNFHGLLGKDGNKQALSIINSAAERIGFKDVQFLMEPVAAAYDYERQLSDDKLVLILDLGGGTTDCSMIKVGPSYVKLIDRQDCILSHTGKRIGGIDLDNKLALMALMPEFGKNTVLNNGLPVPNHLFKQAVTVNDVAAQQEFNGRLTGKEIEEYCRISPNPKLNRLKALRDGKFGLRVSRSAELAKILLSEHDDIRLALHYIEQGFEVPITRTQLSDAIADELSKFERLMKEAIQQAGTTPDVLYVTGGTAMSPVVQNWINSVFPGLEIVIGDHFGSVTSGLTTHAQRIFTG